MEILMYFVLFVVSLAVLLKAADWFVDAAEEIGLSLGISPFIIGVTIVGFGTSLPELATSIASVFAGTSEIVIGNVVGSNITNIALVLGLSVVIVREIKLHEQIWHIDMPFLISSSFLLWFLVQDRKVSIFEAVVFLLVLSIFLLYSFNAEDSEEEIYRTKVTWKSYVWLLVGGALVWFGADYTIFSITKLSAFIGVSNEVIALSFVAVGTSLPEVIVSIGAARKGKNSIAIGNVMGSNIFNTYAVMGIPAFFGDLIIPQNILDFSLPMMIVMTILFAAMIISRRITRWEGLVLLIFYLVFMVELFKQ